MLAVPLFLAAQPVSGQAQFPSEAAAVSVDVAVVDSDGRPVEGLDASAFSVRVDGRERRVGLARYVEVPRVIAPQGGTPAAAAVASGSWSSNAPTAGARVFVIVLDRAGLAIGPMHRARSAAAAFVRGLAPDDRAGLVGIPGASPLVDLTHDKERVAAALERPIAPAGEPLTPGMAASRYRVSAAEAGDIARRDAVTLAQVLERECNQAVRPEDAFPAAEERLGCPREVLVQARRFDVAERQRGIDTVRVLRGLVEALGRVEAPKRMVFVSGGFPAGPELTSELKTLAEAAAAARVSIDTIQPSGPRFEMSDRTAAPDWVAESRVLADGPGRLADLTGGAFLRPLADPGNAFERLARERSGYYLLALEPRDSDRDGKPHAIEVKVQRPRTTVRARTQFVIPSARRKQEPAEAARALLAAPLAVDEVPVEAGTYVLGGEGDRLAVIAELAIGPSAPPAAGTLVYALTDEGGRVITSGQRRLEEPAGGEPARVSLTFDVPAGVYSLRLAVADDRGRRGGLEHPLRARLVAAGGLRLSDVLVGDPSAPRGRQLRPFPATTVDRVAAFLEVAGEGAAGDLAVSFELAASEDGPALVRAAAQLAREPARVTADAVVPLGPLAAGEYVLRAVVRGAAGAGVASRRFRYQPGSAVAAARPAVELLEKVDAYLAEYARRVGAIIAREDYVQREYAVEGRRAERHLVSDLLMARLPRQPWVAYRDVAEVDGRAVRDRGRRLERVLHEDPGGALEQARRFADEGARHNLGRFPRNLNTPTVALALLDPAVRDGVAVERLDDRHEGGRTLARLRVRERRPGVLVATQHGLPVASEAVFSVDPSTGAVVHSRLVVDHPRVRATLEVEFRPEPLLALLVPVEMREDYRPPPSLQLPPSLRRYHVEGVATYRDFVRPSVDTEVLGARPAGEHD